MAAESIVEKTIWQLAQNDHVARLLIPALRACVRYFPLAPGKRLVWTRLVEPFFAWHPHEFVASTVFGARLSGNTRELLQQYVYYFGLWEPQLTCWIPDRLRPGDTFVDVGANIGYFTLLASKLVGNSGKVVAIEASPGTFEALQANLERNHAGNVRAVNRAASESAGVVKVYRGPESHIGLSTIFPEEASKREAKFEGEVEAGPLPVILHEEEMRNARLIKIDVEGAEWSVVSGMRRLLESGRRDLEVMIEIDPECLAQQGRKPEDILGLFSEAGFHAYQLENDYAAVSYLPPFEKRAPKRLQGAIDSVVDLVFSRQDAGRL